MHARSAAAVLECASIHSVSAVGGQLNATYNRTVTSSTLYGDVSEKLVNSNGEDETGTTKKHSSKTKVVFLRMSRLAMGTQH